MIFDALIVVLLTLIAYGVYRFGRPAAPAHHKRFILGALALGVAAAWCDIQDAEVPEGSGNLLTFIRLVHLAIIAAMAGACFGAYKIIQMAPQRRRVPLAWVIGLYLIIYIGVTGYHFYAEAAAVRCDDPSASVPKAGAGRAAAVKDVVTASLMYQRICDKGQNDLRARFARLFHREAAKDTHAARP